MRKLILLAVCAVALFAAASSSATCVEDLPTRGYVCAEPWGYYELCVSGYSLYTDVYSDNCVDSNGDAYHDFYFYGHGPHHTYDIFRSEMYFLAGAVDAGPRCAWVWVTPEQGDPAGFDTREC